MAWPLSSVVQSEFYEATRIHFLRKKNKNNDLFSTIHLLSVSPRQCSAILDITHRTHAAYALLYGTQGKVDWAKADCIEADAEEHTLLAFDG